MPDLDVGVLDRRARPRVHDREADDEREPRLALGDVPARERAVDPVRALGHFGREEAGRRRFGVLAEEVERPRAEDGGQPGAAGRREYLLPIQLGLHGSSFREGYVQPSKRLCL
jgi:hypothetical protein